MFIDEWGDDGVRPRRGRMFICMPGIVNSLDWLYGGRCFVGDSCRDYKMLTIGGISCGSNIFCCSADPLLCRGDDIIIYYCTSERMLICCMSVILNNRDSTANGLPDE